MLNFLSFNPFFRMTSFESVTQCKLFDSVRDKKKEQFLTRLMQISKEEITSLMKKSDRLKLSQKMSKSLNRSQEINPEYPEIGVGFPNFPIIELPIDSIEAFDYENAEKAKYSVNDLREILIEEIRFHRIKREKAV